MYTLRFHFVYNFHVYRCSPPKKEKKIDLVYLTLSLTLHAKKKKVYNPMGYHHNAERYEQ